MGKEAIRGKKCLTRLLRGLVMEKKKKKVKKHCSNLSSKVEVQPFPLTFHSPDETNLHVFIRLGGDRK